MVCDAGLPRVLCTAVWRSRVQVVTRGYLESCARCGDRVQVTVVAKKIRFTGSFSFFNYKIYALKGTVNQQR